MRALVSARVQEERSKMRSRDSNLDDVFEDVEWEKMDKIMNFIAKDGGIFSRNIIIVYKCFCLINVVLFLKIIIIYKLFISMRARKNGVWEDILFTAHVKIILFISMPTTITIDPHQQHDKIRNFLILIIKL